MQTTEQLISEMIKKETGISITIIGAITVLLLLIVILNVIIAKQTFYKKSELLTPAEKDFFKILIQAANAYHIFPKVRMADFIKVQALNPKEWGKAFSKIKAKHIDFLLADKSTLEPILAIELDDKTHQRPDRQQRDIFVDQTLTKIGLPILRIKTAPYYNQNDLETKITKKIADQNRLRNNEG